MSIDVIGVGWGRTGTSTLKTALERLGFGPCYHWSTVTPGDVGAWESAARGEAVEWQALFAEYRSITDWPATWAWRELAATYPSAKIILTSRDPDGWFDSATETIYKLMSGDTSAIADGQRPGWSGEDLRRLIEVSRDIIIDKTLGRAFAENPHRDRELVTQKFREHLSLVREAIEPERLLVYDVAEGWGPLCSFLDVPEPGEPFPHKNRRKSFQEANRVADE